MGKMLKLAEAMQEENWFNNEESSKLIDNAVKEIYSGYVKE